MNRAGNVTVPSARVSLTSPVSIGWRMPCRTELLNSDSSSRKSTPLCASVISPGRIGDPPPTSPASDAEWWGLRNGRTPRQDRCDRLPRHRVDKSSFKRLFLREGWQKRGQPRGKHGLTRPRRPHHEHPMPSRSRYLQGALGDLMPCDIAKIEIAHSAFRNKGREQGQVGCRAHPAEKSQAVLGGPSTLTVSPSSAHTSEQPLFLAHNAKASEAATPRTKPSSESSPTNRRFSMQARLICPVAAKSATAMGESRPEPVFLRELGARLTTILSLGIWNPLDRRAARTRSRASLDRSVAHAHDREARKPV